MPQTGEGLEKKSIASAESWLLIAHIRWIPAVNALGTYVCWAFAEMRDPFTMAGELDALITDLIGDAQ